MNNPDQQHRPTSAVLAGFLCALVQLRLTLIIMVREDIIASKKAVGRPKDLAVIEELELTLDEQKK